MLDMFQIAAMLLTCFVGYWVYWKLKQPNCPGPLTLPFIGSVGLYPYVDNNTAWFDLMSKQYGTTWTGGLPGVGTFVAVLDPESVEYILKSEWPARPRCERAPALF